MVELQQPMSSHTRRIAFSTTLLIAVHLMSCKDDAAGPPPPIQWEQTSLDSKSVHSFAVVGTSIFAGGGAGVFRSTDNGASWLQVSTGLTYFNNSTGQTVAAGVQSLAAQSDGIGGMNIIAGTWGGGIYRSTNNGTSWTQVNSGFTSASNLYDVRSLAVTGTNLLAGTIVDGVFLSTNNGTSWAPMNSGLTEKNVFSFAVNGVNIFAGTTAGVFLSSNNGTSWSKRGLDSITISALIVSGSTHYAGTFYGVFFSTNKGTSWTPANTGLKDIHVYDLAVNGTDLYAGTESGGVFLSTNGGLTWAQFSSGMEPLQTATGTTRVFSLTVSGDYLFAGTWGGGVWRRPL